jgi:hypothetical protein
MVYWVKHCHLHHAFRKAQRFLDISVFILEGILWEILLETETKETC